jgi:hypothetical protein
VTVSLELSDPSVSRPYIEAASPEHPSLLDPTHCMDSLFGVVNIPNVVWIDEDGVIVRPPEPGWPSTPEARPRPERPADEAPRADTPERQARRRMMGVIGSGQDRAAYPDAIRDWVANGADSRFRLSPEQVIEKSQPRPRSMSEGAAHFEIGNHLWRAGDRDLAISHFNQANNLQPDNWTYKRQAWSLVGSERVKGERARFNQGPLPDEEADWPFDSDFTTDVGNLEPGEYYPDTLS